MLLMPPRSFPLFCPTAPPWKGVAGKDMHTRRILACHQLRLVGCPPQRPRPPFAGAGAFTQFLKEKRFRFFVSP